MSPTAGVEKKGFLNIPILEKKKITHSLKNMKNAFHTLGNFLCIPYFISDYCILKIFITWNCSNSCSFLKKYKEQSNITKTSLSVRYWFPKLLQVFRGQEQISEDILLFLLFCRSKPMPKPTHTKFHILPSHFQLASLEDKLHESHPFVPVFLGYSNLLSYFLVDNIIRTSPAPYWSDAHLSLGM